MTELRPDFSMICRGLDIHTQLVQRHSRLIAYLLCHRPARKLISLPKLPFPFFILVSTRQEEEEHGMNQERREGTSFTSYRRTTLGCLSSFSVAISLLICARPGGHLVISTGVCM